MNGDGRHPGYPPSTTHILLSVQLSTKYKIGLGILCVQHDTNAVCVCVNAILTLLQLTLGTSSEVQTWSNKGHIIPNLKIFFCVCELV